MEERERFADEEWCERDDREIAAREHWTRFASERRRPSGGIGDVDLALTAAIATAPDIHITPSLARRLATEVEHFDGAPLTELLEECTGRKWRRMANGPFVPGPAGEGTLVILGPKAPAPLPASAACWVTAVEGDAVTVALEVGSHTLARAELRAATEATIVPASVQEVAPVVEDALAKKIRAAQPGDVVEIEPGKYGGRYVIDKPLTLKGMNAEEVVLDPAGAGPALSIETTELVRLEELTFANARARSGSAVHVGPGADVRISCCLFVSNGCPEGRGGAIHVDRARVTIIECAFAANVARLGGAIAVDDGVLRVARSTFNDSIALRGGAIAASGKSEVTIDTIRAARSQASVDGRHIYAFDTPSGAPQVVLRGTVLFRDDEIRGVALLGPTRLVLHDSAADRGPRRPYCVA